MNSKTAMRASAWDRKRRRSKCRSSPSCGAPLDSLKKSILVREADSVARYCEAVLTWLVREGNYGDVSLDGGLAVVIVVHFLGNALKINREFGILIDDAPMHSLDAEIVRLKATVSRTVSQLRRTGDIAQYFK